MHTPMPLWAPKRDTCARFGFGLTFLDDLIAARKVEARKLKGGRNAKVLVNQPSVAAHIESCAPADVSPTAKRRAPNRRVAERASAR
jgi:hypothetical protein